MRLKRQVAGALCSIMLFSSNSVLADENAQLDINESAVIQAEINQTAVQEEIEYTLSTVFDFLNSDANTAFDLTKSADTRSYDIPVGDKIVHVDLENKILPNRQRSTLVDEYNVTPGTWYTNTFTLSNLGPSGTGSMKFLSDYRVSDTAVPGTSGRYEITGLGLSLTATAPSGYNIYEKASDYNQISFGEVVYAGYVHFRKTLFPDYDYFAQINIISLPGSARVRCIYSY